ncbi:hypothetical protein M9H77_06835 [Catharanthus roseus]|uniref:Uncharacterized protein n=1 Tax=Catharanthus roseus TaxID=4058 RepID=A0ACC0BTD5_CATRO|nr:hypothetical protein M9H77_06835 [Catharanthus roseus]
MSKGLALCMASPLNNIYFPYGIFTNSTRKTLRPGHIWIYKDGTIVRGSASSTSSSSYSLWENNPERSLVPVVDIPDSDFETVDGPVGTEMDIEEDPSEPTTEMDTTEWIENVLRDETTEEPSSGPTSGIPVSPTSFYEGSTSGLPVSSPIAETTGKMLGPHSPDHEAEAMPESSSHEQTNTASHEIIGNFMTKMTELLEATLANRRGERAQSTSNNEALERFLRFRPPEFHGEVEQEAEGELFLEQLNDIYDTLQYEPEGYGRALAPLSTTSFAATVEAATRTEIADQMAKLRTVAINASFHPHKRPGQGCWRPQYPKNPRNSNQIGNGNRQHPMIRNPCPSCTYCGREGHMAETCYRNVFSLWKGKILCETVPCNTTNNLRDAQRSGTATKYSRGVSRPKQSAAGQSEGLHPRWATREYRNRSS